MKLLTSEFNESYLFLTFLLFLVFVFYFINSSVSYLEDNKMISKLDPKYKIYFEYSYMTLFATIVGFLVFFGFKHLKPLFHSIAGNDRLGNLMITTLINIFSLTYAGFIENTMQSIIGEKLDLTPWKNVAGYTVGRLFVVFVLFFQV